MKGKGLAHLVKDLALIDARQEQIELSYKVQNKQRHFGIATSKLVSRNSLNTCL